MDNAWSINDDLYTCVGFGLAALGATAYILFHYASAYWWVFGGTLIFISPFMGKKMDDELEKRESKLQYVPVTSRY